MTRFVMLVGVAAALCGLACGSKGGGLATGTGGSVSAGTGGSTGSGGSNTCPAGNEHCACYPNGTCNGTLTCASQTCVAIAGSGGNPGTGGVFSGTGGNPGGTGGTFSGTGGGNAGTGGCTTGTERCDCYANDTCNSGLTCLSHLCVTTGAGTGGSNVGTGGSNVGTGGGLGTGGSNVGTGGSNIGTGGGLGTGGTPVGTGGTVTTTLVFNNGYVSADSNTYGVQGAVYTFADGVGSTISPDCSTTTAPCFKTFNGTGPICTQGIGTAVLEGDYSTYWGAALGLDLNNATGTKAEFAAAQKGILGFKFDITYTTPPPIGVKVLFTYQVQDPVAGLAAYCVKLDPSTKTNFVPFSSALQDCFNGGLTPLSTTPGVDHLMQLQWQMPTQPDQTTPFGFCIDKITPLMQ
jgi:hypothetical protein